MLPQKIFKIKGLRLGKNAFPDIAHSLALKFGCFKKLSAGFGGGAIAPFPPASYDLDDMHDFRCLYS